MDTELDLPGHWLRPKPIISTADIVTCSHHDVTLVSLLFKTPHLRHVVLSCQSSEFLTQSWSSHYQAEAGDAWSRLAEGWGSQPAESTRDGLAHLNRGELLVKIIYCIIIKC